MDHEAHNTKLKLVQIADNYEKTFFDHFPEQGIFWGKTDVALDRFTDYSLTAHKAWQATEDQFLTELRNLNAEHLTNGPEHITYLLLKENLENNISLRICKDELWLIDPLFGWHNTVAMIAEKQPIGASGDREHDLKRWQTIGKISYDVINNLKRGLEEGYSTPKPVIKRVINQLNIMINSAVVESPFFNLARGDDSGSFKNQVQLIIEEDINPALKQYAQFLENEYYPQARSNIGLSYHPDGLACYQAKIKKETTLDISPQDVHEYGLQYMEQLTNEIIAIGYKEFGTKKVSEIFQYAKADPRFLFTSEQDILKYNQNALERAKSKISQWFDRMPKAEGIIKPYPLHRAKTGAPGEYHPPSVDGSIPGIFYINTYEPAKRSRVDHEATLFHELIPGHHFQIALAQEDETHHSLNKYLWNCGYGEGWALYVERLCDEIGLYTDEISRLGLLANEALRAARLVVDPGIHALNWSREQAINYLKQYTALPENILEGEVDRYIMLPGQATSYMLGKREIEQLRQFSKIKLGNKFNIREFHNQVLKNGAVTLPMLQAQIHRWITEV